MTEWIKCSDRLPEMNQRVLSYDDNEPAIFVFKGDHWLGDFYGYSLNAITYWMPLPLPPEDD